MSAVNAKNTEAAPAQDASNATAQPTDAATGAPARSFHSASLYVGDLHPDVTESILFAQFSAAGTVISIRVCRDTVTRNSLGYAYVNFEKFEDAKSAMESMNFELLMGQPMRIMWSQRDPSLRRSGAGNVFIKNMDKSIDTKSIFDTFSIFGNILSCKVATDKNGSSKGFGFIHFENEESAQKAIDSVNGMLLDGKKVYATKFVQKEARKKDQEANKKVYNNIFVKNFDDKLDDEKLGQLFEKFGEIVSAVVMKGESGYSKGFGFVCFKEPEAAIQAVEDMNDSVVPGSDKRLFVGRAQKKAERLNELKVKHELQKKERMAKFDGVNLYVKNLDDDVTDEQLREQFESFGKITSAKIMRDETDRSKGFGFVCYESRSDATKAVTEMNGKMFKSKPLYVALAQRKEERHKQLVNQHVRNSQFGRVGPLMPASIYPNPQGGFYLNAPMQNGRNNFGAQGVNAQQVRSSAPRWNNIQNAGFPGGGNQQQQFQQQGYNNMRGPRPQGGHPMQQQRFNNHQQRGNHRGMQGGQMHQPQQQQHMRSMLPKQNLQAGYYNQIQQRQQQPPQQTNMMHNHMPHDNNGVVMGHQEQLTAQMLAKASVQEQKQMIGERIYPLVAKICKESDVGKITGMMLEMDNSELLCMLENEELLQSKVNEAVNVLGGTGKE
uniref:Polyadenylate-binding protein n=1 Tax=Arion vulgaris TaxID=1028688 RepID=A0A0B6ZNA9_9EUPU